MINATPNAATPVEPVAANARATAAQSLPPGIRPQGPPPTPAAPKVDFDPEKMMANIRQAIEHLNAQMSSSGRSLGFAMDDVLNRPVVTVKDTKSGEVIRQIPSEAVIRVAHTLEDLRGLLYDAST